MNIVNDKYIVVNFIAGSGGVVAGDLVVISSGTVVASADGDKTATVVGVALETGDATDVVAVAVILEGAIIEAPYIGTSKATLADTDLGTLFDVDDETQIDLDDTTAGCALCIGYNNDVSTIKFLIPATFLYL